MTASGRQLGWPTIWSVSVLNQCDAEIDEFSSRKQVFEDKQTMHAASHYTECLSMQRALACLQTVALIVCPAVWSGQRFRALNMTIPCHFAQHKQ